MGTLSVSGPIARAKATASASVPAWGPCFPITKRCARPGAYRVRLARVNEDDVFSPRCTSRRKAIAIFALFALVPEVYRHHEGSPSANVTPASNVSINADQINLEAFRVLGRALSPPVNQVQLCACRSRENIKT